MTARLRLATPSYRVKRRQRIWSLAKRLAEADGRSRDFLFGCFLGCDLGDWVSGVCSWLMTGCMGSGVNKQKIMDM